MIPVDLITGFLGAGKTTFLLQYAEYLKQKGLRLGILEYDLGAVNIDAELMRPILDDNCELEMVSAACDADCLSRRFRTKLISMAMRGYDRIIVEPSGVFDMDRFFDTLRDEPLDNWYEPGNVIAVVSAEATATLTPPEQFLLGSQVADAGCILLSKTQVVSDSAVSQAIGQIEAACRTIHCVGFAPTYITKPWDTLTVEDMAEIARSSYHLNTYTKTIASTAAEEGFDSVSFLKLTIDADALENRLPRLFCEDTYGRVWRIKGFINSGDGYLKINGVSGNLQITPCGPTESAVTVIGAGLNKDAISTLLTGKSYKEYLLG